VYLENIFRGHGTITPEQNTGMCQIKNTTSGHTARPKCNSTKRCTVREIAGFCHRADEVFALLGCTQHMFVVVWFTTTNTHCIVDGRQVQQEFLCKIQGVL
jgi:hypothetical protein